MFFAPAPMSQCDATVYQMNTIIIFIVHNPLQPPTPFPFFFVFFFPFLSNNPEQRIKGRERRKKKGEGGGEGQLIILQLNNYYVSQIDDTRKYFLSSQNY